MVRTHGFQPCNRSSILRSSTICNRERRGMKIDPEEATQEQLAEYVKKLEEKLDALDLEDFFGTEGWRHYLGIE